MSKDNLIDWIKTVILCTMAIVALHSFFLIYTYQDDGLTYNERHYQEK